MDKRTTYFRLEKMLKDYPEKEIHFQELKKMIMMNIGSNERTVKSSLEILEVCGLLKPLENCKFEIIKNEVL